MKKASLTLLLCIVICLAFGQKQLPSKWPLNPAEAKLAEKYHECLHRNKYSPPQRLKIYPFNNSAEVRLVSFNSFDGPKYRTEKTDPDTVKHYPFYDHKIDTTQFIETKKLTRNQINKLTDILYNVGYRGTNYIIDQASCYEPRNAILFIDAKGSIYAYIEICFECQRYHLSSRKIKVGDFCEQKYQMIKNFFGSAGIEFGITKTEHGKS